MPYQNHLHKLYLLPLECRRELKDLVLIFKDRADLVDVSHRDFFEETEIHNRTRNACKYNYHIPHIKQNYLKDLFYYRSIAAWNKLPIKDTKSISLKRKI